MAKNYSSDAYSKNRTGSEDEMRTAAETGKNSRNCGNKKNSAKSTTSKNTHKDEMDRY
ncbi:MAG TPA: hypothetical protein IAB54_08860 [Candidatus Scatomonas merdigallinarum]|nr:hypothetical protein [Candidatus Scatomonas merdigallinarum]